jgi:hypothetical protein
MPSSRVDFPEPFSPMRNVTCERNARSRERTHGTEKSYLSIKDA